MLRPNKIANGYQPAEPSQAGRQRVFMAHPPAETISVPALFVGGGADPVLGFTRVDRAREVAVGRYHQVMLDGAGHWIQQECPDAINSELLTFLSGVEWT